ncbi:hypothetical protein ACQKWADRAFT_305987 [Trichoderma austrokoningii]
MSFQPQEMPPGSPPLIEQDAVNGAWEPIYRHACTFGPGVFVAKMMDLIKNPNLNSSWLFRADILHDATPSGAGADAHQDAPITVAIRGMALVRTLVRRLVPRNERRDKPLKQTCTLYTTAQDAAQDARSTLVIYMPHAPSADSLPFYHPKVRGIAHLHQWDGQGRGTISVHFLPYPEHPLAADAKLRRTAYHLLEVLDKHGHGAVRGYVKRVNHDLVIPQDRFQNRYAQLKSKYARQMVDSWAEKTDPSKHVFEDLGIAAFLIELWNDMYQDTSAFPGFVDIGCGNGLLVALLTREGYSGWGFDARERKSWAQYKTRGHGSLSGFSLEERLLLPSAVARPAAATSGQAQASKQAEAEAETDPLLREGVIHDGAFPPGTFIISNHADELTPWTPILAAASRCPFIMIPCCSHRLTGEKFRAPPPRDKSKARSTYASLVDWVARIAEDCGWRVETEMLRIPSTRNTCLLGRARTSEMPDVAALVERYGGTAGYYENVAKLLKSGPRGH